MGNSDLGLVTPLSARLQQRARCRVHPKLCLRPFPSHPRSSRRFEKTTKPNQLLISHRGRALGGGAGSVGCRIQVTDLGTASETLADLSNYHVQPTPFLEGSLPGEECLHPGQISHFYSVTSYFTVATVGPQELNRAYRRSKPSIK